jgi:hypothetical protein
MSSNHPVADARLLPKAVHRFTEDDDARQRYRFTNNPSDDIPGPQPYVERHRHDARLYVLAVSR